MKSDRESVGTSDQAERGNRRQPRIGRGGEPCELKGQISGRRQIIGSGRHKAYSYHISSLDLVTDRTATYKKWSKCAR